ncbi:MAG: stage III sporulation protein AF, partial [Eubacterium sp.]|nr:stage III sporulation protein AF [Eubacterium sp.]
AQTMIHFAAGKQYETYMKIIAGVIVLLQFISPFVSSTVDITAKWQEEIEKMTEQAERLDKTWQLESHVTNYSKTETLRQIEEEIKARLNEVVVDRECYISEVSIHLEENGAKDSFGTETGQYDWEFKNVRITMRKRTEEEDEVQDENQINNVLIEEITIGRTVELDAGYEEKKEQARDMGLEEYRNLFAQTLGIAVDRVEVSYYER